MVVCVVFICFFFQAEDGIRDLVRSRGLGDVYKRQGQIISRFKDEKFSAGILAGVKAMDQVTRKNSLPFPYLSLIHI